MIQIAPGSHVICNITGLVLVVEAVHPTQETFLGTVPSWLELRIAGRTATINRAHDQVTQCKSATI